MPDYPLLVALTPQAKNALHGRDAVAIDRVPFRVGRESRKGVMDGIQFYLERRKEASAPSNNLYLEDRGKLLNVSRRHLEIDVTVTGEVEIRDLGSRCGTLVNGTVIGGSDRPGALIISRDSEIVIGTPDSPYRFTVAHLERFAGLVRHRAKPAS